MDNFNLFLDLWYHGSDKLFRDFRFGKFSHNVQLGFGVHFARDRKFAELYGKHLYICRLFPGKVLDVTKVYSVDDEEYRFALELSKRQRKFRFIVDDGKFVINLDIVNPRIALELLLSYGYDGVLYDARYGSLGFGGMFVSGRSLSMVMLDVGKIEVVEVI